MQMNQDFFKHDAAEVAKGILGATIVSRTNGQEHKYTITSAEAYYHDETDKNGKKFCYGASKTKEDAANDVSAPLFSTPGTWCIYGGQLLISVTNDIYPDNILIKEIQDVDGKRYGPDGIANELHLYKTKANYCDAHGKSSVCEGTLFLCELLENPLFTSEKRVNIANDEKYKFNLSR